LHPAPVYVPLVHEVSGEALCPVRGDAERHLRGGAPLGMSGTVVSF